MTQRVNILLSSAGRRVALQRLMRVSLLELSLAGEVMAADMSPMSPAFQAAERSFIVPRCTSPEFIPVMLDICRREEIQLLVPTIDTELPAYAAHRDEFARIGTIVSISSPEVVAIGGNKARTHEWLTRNGFPTVRQATIEQVLAEPSHWPFPFLVKPAGGSSSIGVSVVRDLVELEAATRSGGFIAQTIAKGIEHTIDFLAGRDGLCRCAVPRRRFEVRAGEVSKGMTVRSAVLEKLAGRICSALPGAYGCLNVQVFHDETTDALNVIEINPRFGGGYPLAWEAGAHFPRWIIEEMLGIPSTASSSGWRDRLVMLRYDDAVFVDAAKAGV